jgi:hypothetical protein
MKEERRELWREFSSFPLCFLFYFSGLQTVSKRGRIAAGSKRKTKRKREADFLQRETENGEEREESFGFVCARPIAHALFI